MASSCVNVITKVTQQADSPQLMIRQEEHVSTLNSRQEAKIKSVVTGANAGVLGRPNRMIKPVDMIRLLDFSHSMIDNSNLQGFSSTSSTHIDGIVEGLESLC
ncbi:hypothetical protein RclHR1_18890002 [Rhizophagus clarus]|uniref:Uncharacterized protein n=1 Tax=Rhizophagus clarus TaxID=94130 RepID=A0A2Z6QMJ9_9GLOM|nr:hypothetical protein RclHR1_18890002 [Rhizophagus clarus]